MEELLNKRHGDIVDKLNDVNDGVEEGNVGLKDDNVGVNSTNVGVESDNVRVKDVNVGVGSNNVGEVHDEYCSDDSEDDNYQYDIALEVDFEDEFDGYGEMGEDEPVNSIGYESDVKGKRKKWEEDKEEFKGGDHDNEGLQSGCESDDISGAKRKKYPIFELQKNMSN